MGIATHETDTKPHSEVAAEGQRPVLRIVFVTERPVCPPPIVRIPGLGTPIGRDVNRGVQLEDARVSRHHATVHRESTGSLTVVDEQSKNGTFVNGERVTRRLLSIGDVVSVGDCCLVVAEEPPGEDVSIPSLAGDSAAIRRVRALVRSLGPSPLTVMLTAETGCGKEVVARALHAQSGLSGAFIPVNCAAVPESLFESQLFGHVTGAFTGASAQPGFFRAAKGGTLFLDEISELPLVLQPKLLRAVQERAVVPLGATHAISSPTRIVAATNRDLRRETDGGRFRPDLFARLFEAQITIPPLRDRREDILTLFATALGADRPRMTHALAEALLCHSWPFNVRELMAAARAMAAGATDDGPLHVAAFRLRVQASKSSVAEGPARATRDATAPLGPQELQDLLLQKGGTVSEVARAVGRSRRQVYRWIEKYGLRLEDYRR